MVYAQAARKTGAFMVLAAALSLTLVTFLSGDVQPTGRVIDAGLGEQVGGAGWVLFALGVLTGALVIATYVYVAHIEARREE